MRAAIAFSVILWAAVCIGETTSAQTRHTFNATTAAANLDGELDWWLSWQGAARDRGTHCVSCHSVVPFVLARPRLHSLMHDAAPSPAEQRLWTNVETRVTLWNEIAPF